MTKRALFLALRLLSLSLIVAAVVIAARQLDGFNEARALYPPGSVIAGVPVGGLDRREAAGRLRQAYLLPVELHYDGAVIHLLPEQAGFQLDEDAMLGEARDENGSPPSWSDFWDYLMERPVPPLQEPLQASHSTALIRDFLEEEVAPRYSTPATPPIPVAGTVNFEPGAPGQVLDVESALPLIEAALYSLDQRQVALTGDPVDPPELGIENLAILLEQVVKVAGYDGVLELYLVDLQTDEEVHFALRQGERLEPDVAFTASSIIKIPIMISAFRRMGENPDSETMKLMADMIYRSGNEATDWLMNRVIDADFGPLYVSEDMETLGLENTFLAGYFSFGSPLLKIYETPANRRTDINTSLDLYNQTTPYEVGSLLKTIYECAQTGGGLLTSTFPGEITQAECQTMVEYLIEDRLPELLTAGLPEGNPIAHKHGWVAPGGVINTISDAGIVFSPGGDFVMVVFLNHPAQLFWDPSNRLVADLARAAYNYFNLTQP